MFILYALLVLLIFALCLTPVVFFFIAVAKVHQKAGYPGWSAIIPYYGQYVEAKMGGDENNFWHVLIGAGASLVLSFVSTFALFLSDSEAVGSILELLSSAISIYILVFQVRILYNLSRAFGQGAGFTVGLTLLPIVFYPILAWGNYEYIYGTTQGSNYNSNFDYGYVERAQTQARADYNANVYSQENPFHQDGEYFQQNAPQQTQYQQYTYTRQENTQPQNQDRDILNGDIF